MISELIKTAIFSNLTGLKTTPSGWSKCNCPICHLRGETPDKRQRLGIITSKDGSIGINCFNCNFQTRWEEGTTLSKNFVWFLESVGINQEDLREIKFAAFREREINLKSVPELTYSTKVNWHRKELPTGSRTLLEHANDDCMDENFIKVAQYAMERGITNFNDVYWTPLPDNNFNKRLIIPFVYEGFKVGYTGRYYNDTHVKQIRKYMMDVPEHFVYNLDPQDDDNRKFVIVCEGVLDAYLISGVACLGNSINQKQVDIINDLGKQVVLCPDRDTAGAETIKVAVDNGWAVSFPKWGEDIKDPAQAVQKYGKILTVCSILDSIVSNPLKIHVARKFDNYKG